MAKRKFNKGGEVRLVAYYRYSGGSGQTEQSIEASAGTARPTPACTI